MVLTDEETKIQKKLINLFTTICLQISRTRNRMGSFFYSIYFDLNHFTSELCGTEKMSKSYRRQNSFSYPLQVDFPSLGDHCRAILNLAQSVLDETADLSH